jgi:O-methyltransferase
MTVSSHDARLEDARAHLAAARLPQAAGAGPDPDTLRVAYLDLLKLALCDLAGAGTTSVGAMAGGTVVARELRGDDMRLRAAGMDWPLHGLTMVGLGRLDDLQACVEAIVRDGVDGDVIEAGAWRGGASIFVRAALDCLGDERTVWVADSFQGFPAAPAADGGSLDLAAFDFLAVPVEEVKASFARFGCDRRVQFVPGFFEDTLPPLLGRRWSIVRLDADSYEASRAAIRWLYPGLSPGGYLIVDDYGSFDACRRAVDEYREEHGIAEPIEKVDSTCVRWRREDPAPVAAPPPVAGASQPRAAARPRAVHVPTERELGLAREVAELRERVAAAEAEIHPRAWLRRRLGRAR